MPGLQCLPESEPNIVLGKVRGMKSLGKRPIPGSRLCRFVRFKNFAGLSVEPLGRPNRISPLPEAQSHEWQNSRWQKRTSTETQRLALKRRAWCSQIRYLKTKGSNLRPILAAKSENALPLLKIAGQFSKSTGASVNHVPGLFHKLAVFAASVRLGLLRANRW